MIVFMHAVHAIPHQLPKQDEMFSHALKKNLMQLENHCFMRNRGNAVYLIHNVRTIVLWIEDQHIRRRTSFKTTFARHFLSGSTRTPRNSNDMESAYYNCDNTFTIFSRQIFTKYPLSNDCDTCSRFQCNC